MASLSAAIAVANHAGLITSLGLPNLLPFSNSFRFPSRCGSRIRASSSHHSPAIISTAAGAILLPATVAAAFVAVNPTRARAELPPPVAAETLPESQSETSALSQFLDSNPDAVGSLRSLLYQKLDEGEDCEALAILKRLIFAQPGETEWKFLAARLLNEMGEPAESRRLFEEILAADPLSFEALFENAVLMDQCGEGEAVIERLERALELARSEHKEKAARDVKLIMAQMQFLQKDIEGALMSYEELAKEDPKDYRPYFCQGVIYSLLDRNQEAREKFAKYHELSPKKFDVDAFLQTPLSRVKLFGTGDSGI